MSTIFDKDLLKQFDSIKVENETFLWTGKPKFIPYTLGGLGTGFITIGFGIIWIVMTINYQNPDLEIVSPFFWIFGLLPIIQGLYVFLNMIFSFSNTTYGFSNKRIMIRTGFIGSKYKTIHYDKILNIKLKVTFIDKHYNVGTIKFYSGKTSTQDKVITKLYDIWRSIESPQEVFENVKQTWIENK